MLPIFFSTLSVLALGTALVALWASFRAAFGASDVADVTNVEAESKRVLEERKKALLSNLHDLEFDHGLCKIADEDFQKLDVKLRTEAKHVLRLLDDDVKPFRARAAAMIAEAIGDLGEASYREPALDAETVDEEVVDEPNRCAACETVNDVDAVFCKKCGAPMQVADETTGVEE